MSKINNPADILFETKYWLVKLDASDQTYLGRSYVILKRPCGDLAELLDEELLDFKHVAQKLEGSIKKAFGAAMFNWTCLMNHAYLHTPPDPQVHWHFRPRYSHDVQFEGELFQDTNFGEHYLRGTNRSVNDGLKQKIIAAIKEHLS